VRVHRRHHGHHGRLGRRGRGPTEQQLWFRGRIGSSSGSSSGAASGSSSGSSSGNGDGGGPGFCASPTTCRSPLACDAGSSCSASCGASGAPAYCVVQTTYQGKTSSFLAQGATTVTGAACPGTDPCFPACMTNADCAVYLGTECRAFFTCGASSGGSGSSSGSSGGLVERRVLGRRWPRCVQQAHELQWLRVDWRRHGERGGHVQLSGQR
jgi:hypothetical protein